MTRVHDFVVDLAKAGKDFKAIKEMVDKAYPDSALKRTQIYQLIKTVKEGGDTTDRRGKRGVSKRTQAVIDAVEADVVDDRRVTVEYLAVKHDLARSTIEVILKDDLKLVKKSARWVPKLLSQEQKEERHRCSVIFNNKFARKGLRGFLQEIVTMDESMVAFHTPETKEQSKQWLPKGTPGPLKAKSQASRQKQMVLAFFDHKGMIYTNMVPRGQTVNAVYIVDTLKVFFQHLNRKRPDLAKRGIIFHWDNAPVHTARIVKDFLEKKKSDGRVKEVLEHPPYSPDLAPADYFLFPKVKAALAGDYMDETTFKTTWEGAVRQLKEDDFTRSFMKWVDRHRKCIELQGDYVEKC